MKGGVEVLFEDLRVRGGLHVLEAFIDGDPPPANKGGQRGPDQPGRGDQDQWEWQTGASSRS